MKKKGLIISTVVMAVVLIASLTTATYAWFSASANASIEEIAMNVGAASSVVIGVNNKAIDSLATATSQSSYNSGDVAYDGTKWTGGATALGATITTGITMNVTAGVGTGTKGGELYSKVSDMTLYTKAEANAVVWDTSKESTIESTLYTETASGFEAVDISVPYSAATTYFTRGNADGAKYAMDATYTPNTANHDYVKANGNTFGTLTEPVAAIINGKNAEESDKSTDVIDLQMAINPAKTGIYGTICVITIKPTQTLVGMASAIWADIQVGYGTGAKYVTGLDLFDMGLGNNQTGNVHFDTTSDSEYNFYFIIDDPSTEMAANDATVTPFSIRLFVAGYDEDCNVLATGTGATVDINFYGFDSERKLTLKGSDSPITVGTGIGTLISLPSEIA